MVRPPGLEPGSLAATDFKSVVYTNSTVDAVVGYMLPVVVRLRP